MVGVIILLELNRLKLESGKCLWRWKFVYNLLELGTVVEA
jgi:hypothetical protein